MILACISDIHGQQSTIKVFPKADICIIAGDFLRTGSLEQLKAFLRDIKTWPYDKIILVAGNHDKCLQLSMKSLAKEYIAKDPRIVYLCDQAITIDGVRFYGTPWTPTYNRWYFMRPDHLLGEHVWRFIPSDTDVVITHGPAFGILDRVELRNPGSNTLRLELDTGRIRLKAHIFGHIHESRGQCEVTTLVGAPYMAYNVAYLDGEYKPWKDKPAFTVIEV